MSKFQLLSDPHIDLNYDRFIPWIDQKQIIPSADTLLIAGDIMNGSPYATARRKTFNPYRTRNKREKAVEQFFDYVSSNWKTVIVIYGNHDYWGLNLPWDKEFHKTIENVHFLNNRSIEVDDVVYICSTMWTNIPPSLSGLAYQQNDFKFLKEASVDKWNDAHAVSIAAIEREFEAAQGKDVVVMTHFFPNWNMVDETFLLSPNNCMYATDKTLEMAHKYNPLVWVCGHGHMFREWQLRDDCTFYARNPVGYVFKHELVDFRRDYVIDLEEIKQKRDNIL